MRATNRMLLLWALAAAAPLQAATFDVQVLNFRYQPNDLEIRPGDTVRWTNTSGIHDVRADDGSFTNGGPSGNFTFSRTFNSVGTFPYYCTVHSAPGLDIDTAMNGRIRVVAGGPPPFAINQGHSGAWFEPATAGQGFLIDIEPTSRFIFVAWFTYQVPALNKVGVPEHRWLSAQGNYTADSATNITISQTAGGAFDTPRMTTTTSVGTMTIRFTSCSVGTITYTLNEGLSGEIPIQKLLPNTALCTMLNTP